MLPLMKAPQTFSEQARHVLAEALLNLGHNPVNMCEPLELSDHDLIDVIKALRKAGMLHSNLAVPCLPQRPLAGMIQDLVLLHDIAQVDLNCSHVECHCGRDSTPFYEIVPYPDPISLAEPLYRCILPATPADSQPGWNSWFKVAANILMRTKGYELLTIAKPNGYRWRIIYAKSTTITSS